MAAKKVVQVKALINITHNGESFKIDGILKLNEDEAKELCERGYVEILEKQLKEDAKGGE